MKDLPGNFPVTMNTSGEAADCLRKPKYRKNKVYQIESPGNLAVTRTLNLLLKVKYRSAKTA
jgi:hypothetical protein